jgi:tRNA pseudouridine38-40 synthase
MDGLDPSGELLPTSPTCSSKLGERSRRLRRTSRSQHGQGDMELRYKIVVAYKGTNFCGWQIQDDNRSVSGFLETTFKRVFNAPIKLIGASRTDAGVHAQAQVATFTTDLVVDPEKLLCAWNNALNDDITIRSLERVDDTFHPRHHVTQKTYWYHFFIERPLPMYKPYGVYIYHHVDLNKLVSALNLFVGTHDFRSFCSNKDDRTTIRTIDSIELMYETNMQAYRVIVKGKGFLHHMIRRIVGAALHVARYEAISPDVITYALAHPDAQQVLPNAPARGLMLADIRYTKG